MKFIKYSLLFFIILDGCIDPLNIVTANSKSLVVEGMITDQPGPYTVALHYSKPIGNEIYAEENVIGATVKIISDAGDDEQLTESNPGVFVTKTTQGVVGVTYTAKISIHGLTYESQPEKILPVGDLAALTYEFRNVEDPTQTDYLNTRNGFMLLANTQILPEQEGRVRWRWKGTYEIFTYPNLKTKLIEDKLGIIDPLKGQTGVLVEWPDAPLCGNRFNSCACCYCCTCWVTNFDNVIHLFNQKLSGAEFVSAQYIGFVPATRRLFYEKYKIEVDQMSLSQNIYDYWKRIEVQTLVGSDLFQTPPPNTIGNIIAISDNAPQVYGIFSASAIKTKEIVLSRSDVPYHLPAVDTIKESCMVYFNNSTNVQPPNW